MGWLRVVLMTLAATMAVGGSLAPATAQEFTDGPHIAIRLLPESDRPAAGSEVTLAFVSVPEKGWHGYWQNPGDAGVETRLDWTLPNGVTAGHLVYPVPQRLTIAGIMNYVYEGPFTQFATLKIAPGLAAGTRLPVSVKATYLVCTEEICVPEHAMLNTELTIGDGAIDPARRADFDRWRMALPRALGSPASFAVTGDGDQRHIRLAIPFPADAAMGDAYFFPITRDAIDYGAPQQVRRTDDMLVIDTGAKGAPGAIEGVLKVGEGQGFLVTARPGDVPAGALATATRGGAAGFDWTAALLALGGALLGGLILNIMPCVFPILSLKALSLAKANTDERSARAEALAYTAGVVLVCLALGGILLLLRAGGDSVGWAFQLQNPQVIAFLLILITGIAFNLAGLFELAVPGIVGRLASNGSSGAFATGALAAFIATPCAGPFMGVALGAALVLPPAVAMLIFAGLGLGLAAPFLLLGFVPALRRRLPKPGAWMERFRHILSVPMFATALALAFVLGRQAGSDALVLALGGAVLAMIGLWWVGMRQAAGNERPWWPAVPLLLLGLAAIAGVHRAPAMPDSATPMAVSGAEPFSEARLAALRAEGRPVFAYFTADWCLTCKVNEKAVIETAPVEKALADGKVAVLVGDWTNSDPALGRFIEAHNRAGVPLYLWYRAGSDAPEVLPQILTQSLIERLAGKSAPSS